MKIAFMLPATEKIEVEYVYGAGNVRYKKVMANPKDNGLLAIALAKDPRKISLSQVKDVRPFVSHTSGY